ncbi:MAG: hypothetical protein Q8L84_14060 [Hyphomonas sp.]|nr:hypothetical protein [Hyphomonas sp.]
MRSAILFAALVLGACSQAAPPPEDTQREVAPLDAGFAETEIGVAPLVEAVPSEPERPAPAPEPQLSFDTPPPAAPQAEPQPAAALRDARLVGIWVNENIINSGGADFASYTTVMTMELHGDGRVVQYTESIGGGDEWSYDGGRTIDFEGEWRADGRTLSVYAAPLPDFTPAATYSFSGAYLVTQSDMGRLIWQRRG